MKKENSSFGGIELVYSGWENAHIVVIPVPYDATTTYVSGTRHGPRAIIDASRNMELYDEELERETYQVGICTRAPLEVDGKSPEEMLRIVSEAISYELDSGNFITVLGGEHSISLGVVRELRKRYSHLSVLQLDAHADLRENYQGTPYNHACVGRRIREYCPLLQVGVRSMSKEEADFLRISGMVTISDYEIRQNNKWIEKVLDHLSDEVYLTIDLDVLSPAIMPAVGTPEPGGLNWYEIIALLRAVSRKKVVVSFDVVELCPHPGNVAPDFLAAKLTYRLMGYVATSRGWI